MADAKTEKQKVKEITDKLEEGLKELFEGEKYKSYLSTMSKFHNYSFNNTLLIALQRPDASLVAGYQAWQKNFNRHVNKGEKGIRIIAPAPIGFEDIPGDSKGYFNIEENRIAVQEGMSESQTLKTMVHETAHSVLHNKEVNREDILAPAKDRNTKEVEAESIAFTVCNHFGIDTSDYSFGYIAGWSSGKDMKELKSSLDLDTIRRTASELITGIEEQLREIQRDREIMQGQEKESLLLVQNSDLSEYSLLNVRGMDGLEIIAVWFAEVFAESTEPEEKQRVMEIVKKLAEYKPLAKIEEMEEQNYNMVDNVLNNGAGEKTQKEENRKEQERPAARTSLKARLAEKKALVSGQGKDHEAQENIKNNQREM